MLISKSGTGKLRSVASFDFFFCVQWQVSFLGFGSGGAEPLFLL